MKRSSILGFALAATFAAGAPALAQPGHDDHHNGPAHPEWKKGGHIQPSDWQRGQPVDYHAHHLRAPPHGYEWRQVDGNYVLAAAATGLIAGLAIASH